jgi:hypothetical protein
MAKSTRALEAVLGMAVDDRRAIADKIISECFWGDYSLTADDLLFRLAQHDPGFDRFLFSKIIENSRQPSRYLPMLFAPEVLQSLLGRYLRMAGSRKRVRLVAANLTGQYDLVPELQWLR